MDIEFVRSRFIKHFDGKKWYRRYRYGLRY